MSNIAKKQLFEEEDMISDYIQTFQDKQYLWEFGIGAIPCYLFYAAFLLRYLALKDIGFPRRRDFGIILILKFLFSVSIIILRVLQISAAFNHENYWLSEQPLYSFLYFEFILAHTLSAFLLIYQHLKRLPEVFYCHKLFWGLSLVCQFATTLIKKDSYAQLFDYGILGNTFGLFILGLIKQKTQPDIRNGSRPLIFERSLVELTDITPLQKQHDYQSCDNCFINFKFKSKLYHFQGSVLFEFKVILPSPSHIEGIAADFSSSRDPSRQIDFTQSVGQQSSLFKSQMSSNKKHTRDNTHVQSSSHVLRKTLNDIFGLTSHLSNTYETNAPYFNQELFRNLMKGDQIRLMKKSIKVVESYMRKVGRNKELWDEVFFNFLGISDPEIIRKLIGNRILNRISQQPEQQTQLFQAISVIEDYQAPKIASPPQIQIKCLNTFQKISITLIDTQSDQLTLQVKVGIQNWTISRTKQDLEKVLTQYSALSLDALNLIVDEQGPSFEFLCFLSYFQNTKASQKEHLVKILTDSAYEIIGFTKFKAQVIIDDEGISKHLFDISLKIRMIELKRNDTLSLVKLYKDFKKLSKQVHSQIELNELKFPRKRELRIPHDCSILVEYLEQLLKVEKVRRLSCVIDFLSDFQQELGLNKKTSQERNSFFDISADSFGMSVPMNQSRKEDSFLIGIYEDY